MVVGESCHLLSVFCILSQDASVIESKSEVSKPGEPTHRVKGGCPSWTESEFILFFLFVLAEFSGDCRTDN